MSDTEANTKMQSSENLSTSVDAKETAKLKDLMSLETLRESPVQWPERFPGIDEFLSSSNTPIHTPTGDAAQIQSSINIAAINQFANLPPEQLMKKIRAMYSQIYRLGVRESKEMTRGKLLGIFDRQRLTKTKSVRQ